MEYVSALEWPRGAPTLIQSSQKARLVVQPITLRESMRPAPASAWVSQTATSTMWVAARFIYRVAAKH